MPVRMGLVDIKNSREVYTMNSLAKVLVQAQNYCDNVSGNSDTAKEGLDLLAAKIRGAMNGKVSKPDDSQLTQEETGGYNAAADAIELFSADVESMRLKAVALRNLIQEL